MPMKTHLYPPYWKQFSQYIRFERAKNKCEKCSAPNGEIIQRGVNKDGVPFYYDLKVSVFDANTGEETGQFHYYEISEYLSESFTKVVLTVAHLDRDGDVCNCEARTGRKCANPNHVKALCQRCHLVYDAPRHEKNRRATLVTRKDSERGLLNL